MDHPRKKIYMIAGEPSGDYLGSKVLFRMNEYRQRGGNIEIRGIGGNLMAAQGLSSLFDIKEISVAGIMEIIPHVKKIKKLIDTAVKDIIEYKPGALCTIDSPGFCFRVARKVRKLNPKIRLIHLVAPSVWAWREKRALRLAKLYDELLTLFDFEPIYFTKYGLKTEFVGHPAVEDFSSNSVDKDAKILLLPGSRSQEIKTILPIFMKAISAIDKCEIIIPTLPHLENEIKAIAGNGIKIISNEPEKIELYQKARMAIVASGTATLQLALSGCPMIVCYRMSEFTYRIVRSMAKVKFISLVNLICDKEIVPELIQNDCNPENIAQKVDEILQSKDPQVEDFSTIRNRLIPDETLPSEKILREILNAFA